MKRKSWLGKIIVDTEPALEWCVGKNSKKVEKELDKIIRSTWKGADYVEIPPNHISRIGNCPFYSIKYFRSESEGTPEALIIANLCQIKEIL